jgi:6-phosphogluconolactonase (cycloisomerase 2 family)
MSRSSFIGVRRSCRVSCVVVTAAIVLPFIAASPPADAACNLIPVAKRIYPSTLGGVASPITAPGKIVDVTLTACDVSAGFEPAAATNEVTLRFEPPGIGADTDIVVSSATYAVSDCTLPGGRCRTLTFETPDTTGDLPPNGLAGPARVIVRDAGNAVVAEVGALSLPTLGCDRFAEGVFEQFTVLPPPNNFLDASTGALTELVATVDGGGNLLVPFDYWGGGGSSVLAETPGAPVAIYLEGNADIPAMNAGDPNTIADAIAAQPSPSDFVRSFTLEGRPLPPLLRATTNGGLFGTADAVESVLRIARAAPGGGPAIYDLSDRLSAGGRGPVVIDTFTATQKSPVPLKSLRSSTEAVAFARDENRENAQLNGDADFDDLVIEIVDAATGASVSTGRAVTQTVGDRYADLPDSENNIVPLTASAVAGDLVAFLESEAGQNVTDYTLDGDTDDNIVRVYRRDGTHLTSSTTVSAAAEGAIDARPIAVSGDKVFVRGPSPLVEVISNATLDGASGMAMTSDGSHVYVASTGANRISGFSRNATTGKLTLVNSFLDGVGCNGLAGARAVAVSPDDEHVYVASGTDDAVAVFSRDSGTGALSFVEAQLDGVGNDGLDGASSVIVSPDGLHVYVTGADDGAVAVFDRDSLTGELTFVEVETTGGVDPLLTAHSLAISPDGDFVYLMFDAGAPNSYSIGVFDRNALTGGLTYVQTEGSLTPKGAITQQIVISADGLHLYAGGTGGSFGDYVRNVLTGDLTKLAVQMLGGDGGGFGIEDSVAMSADGTWVYKFCAESTIACTSCSAGLGCFGPHLSMRKRNPVSGVTELVESVHDGAGGVRGLALPQAVISSPDGRFVYATSKTDDAVTVLTREIRLQVLDTTPTVALTDDQPLASAVAVAGGRALVLTAEDVEGTDLNLDGDGLSPNDLVARLYDVSGANDDLSATAVAASAIGMSEDLGAVLISEAGEGLDLNGDGNLYDSVLATFDPALPFAPVSRGVSAKQIAVSGSRVAFITREREEGPAGIGCTPSLGVPARCDLDGDTAALSLVLRVYDIGSGISDVIDTFVVEFVAAGRYVAYFRYETALIPANTVDLNEDGDLDDSVLQVLDMDTMNVINTRTAAWRCDQLEVCEPGAPYKIDPVRRTVSFLTREAEQGNPDPTPGNGTDLDGDGDDDDIVLTVFEIESETARTINKVQNDNTVLLDEVPVFPQDYVDGAVNYLEVIESDFATDLNGDGVVTNAVVTAISGDTDDDGSFDDFDTCVDTTNAAQVDLDGDALGDAACDPIFPTCGTLPRNDCIATFEPAKASISIKNNADPAKDALTWKWSKGSMSNINEFGNPVASAVPRYSLCIYDNGAATPLVFDGSIGGGGTCAGKPCWKTAGASGFKYSDKPGSSAGITGVLYKAGADGKSKVSVKAKGLSLMLPSLPVTGPLQIQFVADTGSDTACFEATYSVLPTNDGVQLKAKSD